MPFQHMYPGAQGDCETLRKTQLFGGHNIVYNTQLGSLAEAFVIICLQHLGALGCSYLHLAAPGCFWSVLDAFAWLWLLMVAFACI